jgi:hypothetical protein
MMPERRIGFVNRRLRIPTQCPGEPKDSGVDCDQLNRQVGVLYAREILRYAQNDACSPGQLSNLRERCRINISKEYDLSIADEDGIDG